MFLTPPPPSFAHVSVQEQVTWVLLGRGEVDARPVLDGS